MYHLKKVLRRIGVWTWGGFKKIWEFPLEEAFKSLSIDRNEASIFNKDESLNLTRHQGLIFHTNLASRQEPVKRPGQSEEYQEEQNRQE